VSDLPRLRPTAFGAPDFAEPIEAWRVWRVVSVDGGHQLGSVIKQALWPPGEPLVARCLRSRTLPGWLRRKPRPTHEAPDPSCECGVYAAELDRVGQYVLEALTVRPVACVIGRVSLWGTVIECERGFRASHAYPLRIYVPADAGGRRDGGQERVARDLSRYGVPVELLPTPSEDATRVLSQHRAA
jgi:hypothetical protein